jgi:hypothetical protein
MAPPTTGLVTALPRLFEGVQQDSITAATVATVGQAFELPMDWNGLPTELSWEVVFPGSAPSSVSIQLEGSDDPAFATANAYVLDGPYTTTTNAIHFVVNHPTRFIRANLTTIGSQSCTARLKNAGKS